MAEGHYSRQTRLKSGDGVRLQCLALGCHWNQMVTGPFKTGPEVRDLLARADALAADHHAARREES